MRTKQSRTNQEARAAGKAGGVRSGALGKLLIMLAIVAAVVFGVAIFFKVSTIEVQGNTVYSSEQIVEASQIQPGDNLLTVNKALAVGNIKAALPYVEDVSIARSLPDGIIIQVRESTISFAVMTDTNTCWLIGPSGKALERIEPAAFNEYPHINGLLLSGPTMGQSVASPTPTGRSPPRLMCSASSTARGCLNISARSTWKRNMTSPSGMTTAMRSSSAARMSWPIRSATCAPSSISSANTRPGRSI